MSDLRKVLILCTGNSCRSQMAEGLINYFRGDQWRAYSAGTMPAGYTHPMAIRVMSELGIDIGDALSESVDLYRNLDPDLVITVCDSAAEECPVWLGPAVIHHVPFPDPAKETGGEEKALALFRQVRDDLRDQLLSLLDRQIEIAT